MRVFVTGATGFIGSAVVQELLGAGHHVIGLARSDASAKSLAAAGAEAHRGSLEDVESLRRGAAKADGAIHTAFFHEFSHASLPTRLRVICGGSPSGIISRFTRAAVDADRRAFETIGKALTGSDRPLVVAFGTLGLKAGRLATEADAYDKNSVGAARGKSEEAISALASLGVRAMVLRLPPLVHGAGDRAGLAPRLIDVAQKKAFRRTWATARTAGRRYTGLTRRVFSGWRSRTAPQGIDTTRSQKRGYRSTRSASSSGGG